LAVIIEPMLFEDLPAVVAIEKDSFTSPWSLKSFRYELSCNRRATYLVARVDGTVVGYGGVWIILDEAHITTLAVDRRFRRCGIATRLLAALIDISCQKGAERITLEVRPSNHPARRLYEKFGFTVKGVRKKYYINEDGLIMFKEDLPRVGDNREPAS